MKALIYCLPLFLGFSDLAMALSDSAVEACFNQRPEVVALMPKIYPRMDKLLTAQALSGVHARMLQLQNSSSTCDEFVAGVVPYIQSVIVQLDGIEALGKN